MAWRAQRLNVAGIESTRIVPMRERQHMIDFGCLAGNASSIAVRTERVIHQPSVA
jgi:hypothetical protein